MIASSLTARVPHHSRAAAYLLSGAAIALFAPLAAYAQDATVEPAPPTEAEASAGGEEIVVTARLREERLQDAPVAITALSGAQLETLNATSVADIASLVPSMVIGRQATGSSASIFLRGVGSSSLSAGFDQSVSLNLDGLAMSRGRELLYSQFDLAGVEVLKGPQALYFGRNTTGGLMSITSKNPGPDFEASAKGGYGFEAREIYGEAMVSAPLSETLGARIAARYSKADGAFVNTAGPSVDPATGFARTPTGARRGEWETFSGRLTLDFEPTDTIEVRLKGGLTKHNDDGAATLYERKCGGGRTTPFPTSGFANPFADCAINGRSDHSKIAPQNTVNWRFARNGETYTDLDSAYGILTANIDGGAFAVTSITGYYQFTQDDLGDFNGATRTVAVAQGTRFDQFSQELRFRSQFDGPINVLLGGFYASSSFDYDIAVYILPLPFDAINNTYVTFDRDNGFDAQTLSGFGELTWDITDRLELSAGARWSADDRRSFQLSLPANRFAVGPFPPNRRFDDKFSDTNVSPQASLSFKPTADLTAYVAYKEGYKTGGFNISQVITAAASLAAGRFGSETAKGWEAGVRGAALGRQLRFGATVYDFLYQDLQVQFFDPVTAGQIVSNAGELRTRGIEADFNYSPEALAGFSLRGAVAYNHAEYDDFIGQCYGGQTPAAGCNQQPNAAGVFNGQVYSGRTPPKAPRWAASAGAAYEVPLGASLRAIGTADANYSSKYNYTDTLRPDAIQPAYTKIDASLALEGGDGRWKIALIGRNLTNEFVATSANDMSFAGGTGAGTAAGVVSDMNVIVERPREIFLEVSTRF